MAYLIKSYNANYFEFRHAVFGILVDDLFFPYTEFQVAEMNGRGLKRCANIGHFVTCIYRKTQEAGLMFF